jgi:hypothetical protein
MWTRLDAAAMPFAFPLARFLAQRWPDPQEDRHQEAEHQEGARRTAAHKTPSRRWRGADEVDWLAARKGDQHDAKESEQRDPQI